MRRRALLVNAATLPFFLTGTAIAGDVDPRFAEACRRLAGTGAFPAFFVAAAQAALEQEFGANQVAALTSAAADWTEGKALPDAVEPVVKRLLCILYTGQTAPTVRARRRPVLPLGAGLADARLHRCAKPLQRRLRRLGTRMTWNADQSVSCDVAVVGSGVAGAHIAFALARKKQNVVILEAGRSHDRAALTEPSAPIPAKGRNRPTHPTPSRRSPTTTNTTNSTLIEKRLEPTLRRRLSTPCRRHLLALDRFRRPPAAGRFPHGLSLRRGRGLADPLRGPGKLLRGSRAAMGRRRRA